MFLLCVCVVLRGVYKKICCVFVVFVELGGDWTKICVFLCLWFERRVSTQMCCVCGVERQRFVVLMALGCFSTECCISVVGRPLDRDLVLLVEVVTRQR